MLDSNFYRSPTDQKLHENFIDYSNASHLLTSSIHGISLTNHHQSNNNVSSPNGDNLPAVGNILVWGRKELALFTSGIQNKSACWMELGGWILDAFAVGECIFILYADSEWIDIKRKISKDLEEECSSDTTQSWSSSKIRMNIEGVLTCVAHKIYQNEQGESSILLIMGNLCGEVYMVNVAGAGAGGSAGIGMACDLSVSVVSKFNGHVGSVRGVDICIIDDWIVVCSVGDDWNVCMWRLPYSYNVGGELVVNCMPMCDVNVVIGYGHSNRVWTCKIDSNHRLVFTGSEDGCVRAWDFGGNCLFKWKMPYGEGGLGVLSMVILSGNNKLDFSTKEKGNAFVKIAIGCGDSSVRILLVHLNATHFGGDGKDISSDCWMTCSSKESFPRNFTFLSHFENTKEFLVFDDEGRLFSYSNDWRNGEKGVLYKLSASNDDASISFSRYIILENAGDQIFVGDRNGNILNLDFSAAHRHPGINSDGPCIIQYKTLFKLPGKVSKIFPVELPHSDGKNKPLLFCYSAGEGRVYGIYGSCLCFNLNFPSGDMALSVVITNFNGDDENIFSGRIVVFVGSRNGFLFEYTIDNPSLDEDDAQIMPTTVHKLSNNDGIVGLAVINDILYVGMRDGRLKEFSLKSTPIRLLNIRHVIKGSRKYSIEGLLVVPGIQQEQRKRLLVVVFHDKKAMIIEYFSNQIIFSVDCGGSHRIWKLFYSPVAEAGTAKNCLYFAYIRHSSLLVNRIPFDINSAFLYSADNCMASQSSLVVQQGYHSREVRCGLFLNQNFVVSSGESGDILIGHVDNCLAMIDKLEGFHSSSVTTLVPLIDTPCREGGLFLSGGGKSELFLWKYSLIEQGKYSCLILRDFSEKQADLRIFCVEVIPLSAKKLHRKDHLICISYSSGELKTIYYQSTDTDTETNSNSNAVIDDACEFEQESQFYQQIKFLQNSHVSCMKYQPDKQILHCGLSNGSIQLLGVNDTFKLHTIHVIRGAHMGNVLCLETVGFYGDCYSLISGGYDGELVHCTISDAFMANPAELTLQPQSTRTVLLKERNSWMGLKLVNSLLFCLNFNQKIYVFLSNNHNEPQVLIDTNDLWIRDLSGFDVIHCGHSTGSYTTKVDLMDNCIEEEKEEEDEYLIFLYGGNGCQLLKKRI